MSDRQLRRKARRKQWDPRMLNGFPEPKRKGMRWIIMEAVRCGLVVTSTTGGRHAPGSFHYQERAIDFGLPGGLVGTRRGMLRMLRFQRRMHRKYGRRLKELFGPSNYANRKWGAPLRLAEGSGLEQLHDNHVHVAV